MVNVSLVVFVTVCGCINANFDYWQIPAESVPSGFGKGGFLPYGIIGVIKGAGMCFFAFVGFDVIATAGEEAKDPKHSIPFAICTSLIVIFISYFGISTALTLMVPYFEQDTVHWLRCQQLFIKLDGLSHNILSRLVPFLECFQAYSVQCFHFQELFMLLLMMA